MLTSLMLHNILMTSPRLNETMWKKMKVLITLKKISKSSCLKFLKILLIIKRMQASISSILINIISNPFEILLTIWTYCKIKYIAESRILMYNILNSYTSASRMRFARKAIIMQISS